MTPPLPRPVVEAAVRLALAEDVSGAGDVTSLACVPGDAVARFVLRARQAGRLCGLQPAIEAFRQTDARIVVSLKTGDGMDVQAGEIIAEIHGPARGILTAERVALNFLGRMSGIATLTRDFVRAVDGTGVRIAHTRKTTPGLRAFEVQAVRAGGGAAHRFSLSDAILIKDNHVAIAGSAGEAVRRAKAYAGHMTAISVEIDTLDQLDEVLEAGATVILLDNFSISDMRAAAEQAKGRAQLEASGGVSLPLARAIAETGVDVISIGALTHSAPNFDVGLDAG